MKKTALILLNLGGPSSLKEVKAFLFKLFYDEAIIKLPNPARWIVAKILSNLREKKAKNIYSKIGGASPILSETIMQKNALIEKIDNEKIKVFIAMRYSMPDNKDAVKKIKEYGPDEVILLPLYPQFSTTTTKSSIDSITKEMKKSGISAEIKSVCCYPTNKNFIKAHIDLIKETLKKVESKDYRILFSAHSLPEKIIRDGDPYKWQIEASVNAIVSGLKIKDLDYKITYQSKVTPVKWLEPDTESEIKKTSNQNIAIIIVPISFVSDHSETLVELDIEYKELADKGSIEYHRVPTLGTSQSYITALAEMVKSLMKNEKNLVTSDKMSRICPSDFNKCVCKDV